jgi:Insect cuticle protein
MENLDSMPSSRKLVTLTTAVEMAMGKSSTKLTWKAGIWIKLTLIEANMIARVRFFWGLWLKALLAKAAPKARSTLNFGRSIENWPKAPHKPIEHIEVKCCNCATLQLNFLFSSDLVTQLFRIKSKQLDEKGISCILHSSLTTPFPFTMNNLTIILGLALAAVAVASPHGESYVKRHDDHGHHTVVSHGHGGHGDGGHGGHGDGGHGGHGGDDGHDYHHHPSYKYEYGVKDPKTKDHHSQWEHRDGDKVVGEYTLDEADGTKRVVKYSSDKKTGFTAHVERIGHAQHDHGHGGHGGHGHHWDWKYRIVMKINEDRWKLLNHLLQVQLTTLRLSKGMRFAGIIVPTHHVHLIDTWGWRISLAWISSAKKKLGCLSNFNDCSKISSFYQHKFPWWSLQSQIFF